MGSAEQSSKFKPLLVIVFIKAAAAFFCEYGKRDVLKASKGRTINMLEGCYDRYLMFGQVQEKIMLILQSIFRPPAGAIEFYYQAAAIPLLNFKDTVDITGQWAAEIGALNSQAFLGKGDYPIRCERVKGCFCFFLF
jgi:hypothetical protein